MQLPCCSNRPAPDFAPPCCLAVFSPDTRASPRSYIYLHPQHHCTFASSRARTRDQSERSGKLMPASHATYVLCSGLHSARPAPRCLAGPEGQAVLGRRKDTSQPGPKRRAAAVRGVAERARRKRCIYVYIYKCMTICIEND